MTLPNLDEAVYPARDALIERDFLEPQVIFLLGTGPGTLPGELTRKESIPLGDLPGVPEVWSDVDLMSGEWLPPVAAGEGSETSPLRVWMVTDGPADLLFGEGTHGEGAPWEGAFPIWLASAAGAGLCVHTCAGATLAKMRSDGDSTLEIGHLAVLKDHINLSGVSPLVGMGQTRLGPLFPDQSRLHDGDLREHALQMAKERGIVLEECVAACTIGPALDTPAEMRWIASSGADLAVQGLANPLLACAHAGLSVITFVAVTDDGARPLDMSLLLSHAEACAPSLDDLVRAMLPELASCAGQYAEEL